MRSETLLTTSRAVAFSAVMALLPGLVAFVSLYGLMADAAHARDHLALLAGLLPPSSLELLGAEMERIATVAEARLSATFIGGLAVAFWTANSGMRALVRGIDQAYGETGARRSWRVSLAASGLTLSAFALLLLTTGVLILLPRLLGLPPTLREWQPLSLLRWPLLFGLAVLVCELLYRFGPSRPLWRWRWISAGSTLTACLWLTGSASLAWYAASAERFAATYGSLGAVFAVLIWIWSTALMILLGASLNAEIERKVVRSPTARTRQPAEWGEGSVS